MHPSRLLRAAPFRLALIYAGLFSLSVLALGAISYFATTQVLENQLRTTVTAELQALRGDLERQGPAELVRTVASRVADPAARAFAYLLQDSAGRRLAGDLPPTATDETWRLLVPSTTIRRTRRTTGTRSWAVAWSCRMAGSCWLPMTPSSCTSSRNCCCVASAGRWRSRCR